MTRIFYRYNSETCKYEPILDSKRVVIKKIMWFYATALLIATTGFAYYSYNHMTFDEARLMSENQRLKVEWEALQSRLNSTSKSLATLENEDDNYYRVVLDMKKLDESIRQGGIGGREKYDIPSHEQVSEVVSAYDQLERLSSRLEIETKSLEEIDNKVSRFDDMMDSRPAMQPIDNRQLTRFNTIFGMRKHPIHGDWRNHNGLDLTADMGTPVYATGDGVVVMARYNGGYGNVIFLSHGYGFESRYAHLSKFKVTPGQKVKRGDLIGYVGSTGLSTNPHLHYEVLYNNKWINPIYFMYRDLPQSEYNKLINKKKKEAEKFIDNSR